MIPVLVAVAIAGFATMSVELSAVRLLAPWYGASSGVWTNVIGVVLLALALGYRLGAGLARGAHPAAWLARALFAAAVVTFALPYAAGPVARLFLPAGLALDEAAALLVWGSLAASLLLFLPSAALLGLVCPLAVEVVQRRSSIHAGEAGGRVLALSTLGSLAGTFSTTHYLMPELGLRWSFLAAALALVGAGLCVSLDSRRASTGGALLALLCATTGALVRPTAAAVPPGLRLLEQRESRYQLLRVVESEGGEPRRRLAVNEALDSFQSVWQPSKGLLPLGYYYNLFVLPAWWSEAEGPWRLLVLGLGAGTTVRVMEGALPPGRTLTSLGVEIDAELVALGERWFDLESGPERRVLRGADARAVLALSEERWDEIVLDAYANNMEIPGHLATLEYFGLLREHLVEGGTLAINAAGFGLADPIVDAVGRTCARAFQAPVLALRVPFARNCILLARRGAPPPDPTDPSWLRGDGPLAALREALELPGSWRWIEPGADVLTDDLQPIDALQRESVRRGRERWLAQ